MGEASQVYRARMVVLGREWWIPLVGAAVAIAYDAAMFVAGTAGVDFGVAGYLGGAVGGFVAGALLGTNWADAMTVGLRAGAISITIVSVAFAGGSFAVWYTASGIPFFYWSSFFGAVVFLVMAPVHSITGAVGGALGVLLRRFVVPRRHNPPAR